MSETPVIGNGAQAAICLTPGDLERLGRGFADDGRICVGIGRDGESLICRQTGQGPLRLRLPLGSEAMLRGAGEILLVEASSAGLRTLARVDAAWEPLS